MAVLLDNLGKAKRHPILPGKSSRIGSIDSIEVELHAAKEILAEVFGITVAEAEEMIKQRCLERMLWPENLRLNK
jgi:endonuclease V-like protein UPF0215 family